MGHLSKKTPITKSLPLSESLTCHLPAALGLLDTFNLDVDEEFLDLKTYCIHAIVRIRMMEECIHKHCNANFYLLPLIVPEHAKQYDIKMEKKRRLL